MPTLNPLNVPDGTVLANWRADLSTLSSRTHIVLETLDGGTTVYGYRAGGNFS